MIQTLKCIKGLPRVKIYMLFAGWEVRMVKNCDRGLENTARGRRPRAAFSRPKRTRNNFIYFFGASAWQLNLKKMN